MNTGYHLDSRRGPLPAASDWARTNLDIPMNSLLSELNATTAEILAAMVRSALRRTAVEIADWQHEGFGHSLGEVYGEERSIIKVSGAARDPDGSRPRALVLKIETTPGVPEHPPSPGNGDRECGAPDASV
jgi:hypothetical protein